MVNSASAFQFSYSSTEIPNSFAISSPFAVLPHSASIFAAAASIFFCFCLSVLGIQSIFRISSKIAPRILKLAYVSNFTFFSMSYLSMASIKPKIPYPTKSSYSTVYPKYILSLPATKFTTLAYSRISCSRNCGVFFL